MRKNIKAIVLIFIVWVVFVIACFEVKYKVKLYDSPNFKMYGVEESVYDESNRLNPPNDKKILCEYFTFGGNSSGSDLNYDPINVYAIVYSDGTVFYARKDFGIMSLDTKETLVYSVTCGYSRGYAAWVNISRLQYFILEQRLMIGSLLKDLEIYHDDEFDFGCRDGTDGLYYNGRYDFMSMKVGIRSDFFYETKKYIIKKLLKTKLIQLGEDVLE